MEREKDIEAVKKMIETSMKAKRREEVHMKLSDWMKVKEKEKLTCDLCDYERDKRYMRALMMVQGPEDTICILCRTCLKSYSFLNSTDSFLRVIHNLKTQPKNAAVKYEAKEDKPVAKRVDNKQRKEDE